MLGLFGCLLTGLLAWLLAWWVGCLLGGLVACLVGWLLGGLVAWWVGCLVAWLLGCLVGVGWGWLGLVGVGWGWLGLVASIWLRLVFSPVGFKGNLSPLEIFLHFVQGSKRKWRVGFGLVPPIFGASLLGMRLSSRLRCGMNGRSWAAGQMKKLKSLGEMASPSSLFLATNLCLVYY